MANTGFVKCGLVLVRVCLDHGIGARDEENIVGKSSSGILPAVRMLLVGIVMAAHAEISRHDGFLAHLEVLDDPEPSSPGLGVGSSLDHGGDHHRLVRGAGIRHAEDILGDYGALRKGDAFRRAATPREFKPLLIDADHPELVFMTWYGVIEPDVGGGLPLAIAGRNA